MSAVDDFEDNYGGIYFLLLFPLPLPSNSRPSRLWSRASSSVVLKVCLCCYALWLGCQLTPTDLSQKADCRGIPITLPRPNPLSSLWHLSPFCQFPPLLLSSPFWSWQQRHPQGPPWCETHSWSFFPMFLYLIVALLSYSASTIFTHQKTKKQGSFHVGTPANMLITWGLAVVMLAQQRQDISETPQHITSDLTRATRQELEYIQYVSIHPSIHNPITHPSIHPSICP